MAAARYKDQTTGSAHLTSKGMVRSLYRSGYIHGRNSSRIMDVESMIKMNQVLSNTPPLLESLFGSNRTSGTHPWLLAGLNFCVLTYCKIPYSDYNFNNLCRSLFEALSHSVSPQTVWHIGVERIRYPSQHVFGCLSVKPLHGRVQVMKNPSNGLQHERRKIHD